MTWFCGNRQKHRNKSKVSNVQYSRDDNDNAAAVNNAKQFAVVLQNFEASVSDELSVTRGQVVEMLYQDNNWIYVRNVDTQCGYIPLNFCYGMDQIIGGGQHWNANEVQGSNSGTESPPQTRPHPKSINLGTFVRHSGSQSSVEVHNIEPRVITPQQQPVQTNSVITSPSQHQQVQEPLRSSTPVSVGGRSAAQRLETPDSTPPMARSNRRLSSLQPSMEHMATDGAESTILEEPRYIERPHNNTIATAEGTVAMGTTAVLSSSQSRPPRMPVRRSLSMNEGARLSCRSNVMPLVQRKDPIQRSISYQEAVLSAGQDPYRLIAGNNRTLMHRDSPLNPRAQQGHTTPPQQISPLNLRCQQQLQPGGHMIQRSNALDYDPSDDVFLPESKKPVGIYRCIQTYRPRYQGELSVKEGELVILLEFGRGDWAWVLTSMNQEGLLPRQHLVRYNPRLGVGGPGTRAPGAEGVKRKRSSNVATQTELVIEGCVRHVSGASSASAGATAYSASSSSSVTTPQTTPPLTLRAKRLRPRTRPSTRAKEVVNKEERCVIASPAAQAKEPSPKWFEDVDSLERPPTRSRPTQLGCTVQTTPPSSLERPPTRSRPTQLGCTVQTTPPNKHRRRPNNITTVAVATPQSVKSADACCLDNRSPNPAALVTPKPVKSADYTGPASAEFWFNSLSSTTSTISHQAPPTLTAMKEYDPPPNAKNCLKLSKGDVLNTQPHMHYPKGWMWVWHTTQRSFGYVPQSHVGYTYPVIKGERSRKNTEEDAV